MVDDIIQGAAAALRALGGADTEIYQDEIRQGLSPPCYFLGVLKPSITPLLGRRYLQRTPLDIQYFPADPQQLGPLYDLAEELAAGLQFITLPDGSRTKIIINIEAQQKSNPGYSLLNRGIFYAAQLSVEFTNDGSDKKQYDNMKKVYSIWICMDCPEDKKDSIINYSFEPHIIYQGNEKLKVYENCDLMNITFIHLSGKPDQSHHRLIAMLDTLLARMDAETKKGILNEVYAYVASYYLYNDDAATAKAYYEKMLALNPENQALRDYISKMKID